MTRCFYLGQRLFAGSLSLLLFSFFALFALFFFSFSSGCKRDEAGAPVDVEVMAFLSEARALHHQANVREDSGDLEGAKAALGRLTTSRRPHPERTLPEVEEVLADAHARFAELKLRTNDFAGAEAEVRAGLLHAPDPTYFRGHLLEVQGIVEESRGAFLADAGRSAEAAEARARAIQLLQDAVNVQDQVVSRTLADGGKP